MTEDRTIETRKLGPIAAAFYAGFASSGMRWNGDDLPLEIGRAFDKSIKYAKQHGEEPTE